MKNLFEHIQRRKTWRLTLLILCSVLVAVSCASPPQADDEVGNVSEDVRAAVAAEGPVVLAKMNWTNQLVNTELARRILAAMGADVTTQTLDASTVFAGMAKSDNMVDMEVWSPTAQNFYDEYVTKQKSVAIVGGTGYVTEEGWYVPTYVIKGDPERGIKPTCPGLPDYRAINECAAVFATPSSDGQARYVAGDPAWEPLYGDTERIKNLGVNVKHEYAGSEASLVAEWKRALDRGEPMIGLMWSPHMVTTKYDLTLIEMPPYTPECWGTTYACAWEEAPNDILASAAFSEGHPVAAKFLENYEVSKEQIGEIMVRIDSDGLTVEEAVDEWMKANESVWQPWIPTTV